MSEADYYRSVAVPAIPAKLAAQYFFNSPSTRNPVPVPLEHLVCLLQSTAAAIGEGFG